MFPSPDDQQQHSPKRGLEGADGLAGDARNEPEDAPTTGSDADEVSTDSVSPAGIAESLTRAAPHDDDA
jgi:hypothetical protein